MPGLEGSVFLRGSHQLGVEHGFLPEPALSRISPKAPLLGVAWSVQPMGRLLSPGRLGGGRQAGVRRNRCVSSRARAWAPSSVSTCPASRTSSG